MLAVIEERPGATGRFYRVPNDTDVTRDVGAAPAPVFLVRMAKTSKALRRALEQETPTPLKKRDVLATAQYLSLVQ
jgi:hypothetical protein